MKKNQTLPVLGAAASPGTLSPGPAASCHEHTHKTPGLTSEPARQIPLPCPALPRVRASQHSPQGSASCHSSICTVSPLEHFSRADPGCRTPVFTQTPLQGPLPQCRAPQLMRLGLPAFQKGFSMMGRLQALGCPPFHEEVIPEHLLAPQLRRPDGKSTRAGRGFRKSFLPSSLQVCPH